jgi:hypothetical protein
VLGAETGAQKKLLLLSIWPRHKFAHAERRRSRIQIMFSANREAVAACMPIFLRMRRSHKHDMLVAAAGDYRNNKQTLSFLFIATRGSELN